MQDLEEPEGRVQEAGEDPLLRLGDAHFVHLQQIHHHLLVQPHQPLEDRGI